MVPVTLYSSLFLREWLCKHYQLRLRNEQSLCSQVFAIKQRRSNPTQFKISTPDSLSHTRRPEKEERERWHSQILQCHLSWAPVSFSKPVTLDAYVLPTNKPHFSRKVPRVSRPHSAGPRDILSLRAVYHEGPHILHQRVTRS